MLTRLLIQLRWPMAVLVALVVAAIVLNGWFGIHAFLPISTRNVWVSMGIEYRGLYFTCSRTIGPGSAFITVNPNPVWSNGWEYFTYWTPVQLYGTPFDDMISFPLWAVALPPAAIGFAGFRSKCRQPIPGKCAWCRHTLAGASVCPECGRTSTTNVGPPTKFVRTETPLN